MKYFHSSTVPALRISRQIYASTPCCTLTLLHLSDSFNYFTNNSLSLPVQWKPRISVFFFLLLIVCDKLKDEAFLYALRKFSSFSSEIKCLNSPGISWKMHRHKAENCVFLSSWRHFKDTWFSQDSNMTNMISQTMMHWCRWNDPTVWSS